jgi:type II secretory pathway component PulM
MKRIFILAGLFLLCGAPVHACVEEVRHKLERMDSLLSEYKQVRRETKVIAEVVQESRSKASVSRFCTTIRRQAEIERNWLDTWSQVESVCPEFARFARENGGGQRLVRHN